MSIYDCVIAFSRSSCNEFLIIAGIVVLLCLPVLLRPDNFPLSRRFIAMLVFCFTASGLIGCKVSHIAYLYLFEGVLVESVFSGSGWFLTGACIFAFFSIWIISRFTDRARFFMLVDYIAPFTMLFVFIIRCGCSVNGCCHGVVLKDELILKLFCRGIYFPTQFFDGLAALLIYISSRRLYSNCSKFEGLTFYYCVMMYSMARFFTDTFRYDAHAIVGLLKVPHLYFLALFLFGCCGMARVLKDRITVAEDVLALIAATTSVYLLISVMGIAGLFVSAAVLIR